MVIQKLVQAAVKAVPHSMRSKVKDWPLIGAAQRLLVDRHLTGQTFVHKVDAGPSRGIIYELTLPEDKGIWTGNYEPEFAGRFAAEVRRGMVGYDIGSWHGYFAGILAAQGASEIVMFEPLPQNLKRLQRMIELNPMMKASIQPVALSDREGLGTLTHLPETSMAKLADSPFQPDRIGGRQTDVCLQTMDTLVARGDIPPPDIIKIDVEGAEAMLLKGAAQTLANAKPVILAEIHSQALMDEVSTLLKKHGYKVEKIKAKLKRETDAQQICAKMQKRFSR